ncbi:MAG: DUF2262 domain-containing protein [Planctomycetota bacterium]
MQNYAHFSLCCLLVLCGCSRPKLSEVSEKPFRPSELVETLADIDVSPAEYNGELVVIQGLVSEAGQGGWAGINDNYEVHSLSFAAWHKLGESSVTKKLTILRPVRPEADYWDDFPKLTVQRLRVLLSDDETRAIVEEELTVEGEDKELEKIAIELSKPVIFTTVQFGDFVLDRRLDQFEVEAEWNGRPIRLTLPNQNGVPSEAALNTAALLWEEEVQWMQRVQSYAATELLDVKNDTWLAEGESKFTHERFISKMSLDAVDIESDGSFEFWFDDGDLFWGHFISVRGNLGEGPTDSNFHG